MFEDLMDVKFHDINLINSRLRRLFASYLYSLTRREICIWLQLIRLILLCSQTHVRAVKFWFLLLSHCSLFVL